MHIIIIDDSHQFMMLTATHALGPMLLVNIDRAELERKAQERREQTQLRLEQMAHEMEICNVIRHDISYHLDKSDSENYKPAKVGKITGKKQNYRLYSHRRI